MPFSGGAASGGTQTISGAVTVTSGAVETDRKVTSATLTIANGAAVSDALDMRDYGGGLIYMPADWTAADLGAQICATIDGTYQTLKDRSNGFGTDVSIDGAVDDVAYPIPAFWFGAHFLKLFSHNGSGVAANQGAARSIVVMLKS